MDYSTRLTILSSIAKLAVPGFLIAALAWALSDGRRLSKSRRLLFAAGWLSSTIAYATHLVLHRYLNHAHIEYWAKVDTMVGIGGLMFLASVIGLVGGSFGKSYGRVSACLAGLLVAAMWWFTAVANF